MKKFACILAALMLTMTIPTFAANGDGTSASYATVAPVIDGQIDDIWNYTESQVLEDGSDITGAYSKILWDNTGLYYLAVVNDSSMPDSDPSCINGVDIWVSEKNTQTDNYNSDPGDYNLHKSSTGVEVYYNGNDKLPGIATMAVALTDTGYIVEAYCPYLSDIKPAVGDIIGYNISINDDIDNDGTRDSYVPWDTTHNSGAYWDHTDALVEIEFVAGPDASLFATETEAPVVEEATEAPATETPADNTSAPQTFDGVIAFGIAAFVSAAAIATTRRRKNK